MLAESALLVSVQSYLRNTVRVRVRFRARASVAVRVSYEASDRAASIFRFQFRFLTTDCIIFILHFLSVTSLESLLV